VTNARTTHSIACLVRGGNKLLRYRIEGQDDAVLVTVASSAFGCIRDGYFGALISHNGAVYPACRRYGFLCPPRPTRMYVHTYSRDKYGVWL